MKGNTEFKMLVYGRDKNAVKKNDCGLRSYVEMQWS